MVRNWVERHIGILVQGWRSDGLTEKVKQTLRLRELRDFPVEMPTPKSGEIG
uniref:Uncharacterized protein n=1 Tax=Cucumis melo TaxID=3656 RepID=A0A9I9D4C9_CUCME